MNLFGRSKDKRSRRPQYDEYPSLANLVHGYFHQDYDIISEDSDIVIATYKSDSPSDIPASIIEEIHRFLDRYGSDETQLTQAFERIFRPETSFHRFWGRTTRESLLRVADIMAGKPVQPPPAE
jgi:hypothetical protein